MRLIDADALISYTREAYCKNCERRKGTKNGKVKFVYDIGDVPCRACDKGDMIDRIDEAPTVEPKQGRWEFKPDPYGFFDEIPVCSECGCTNTMRKTYRYCPHCGTRMEGGEADD